MLAFSTPSLPPFPPGPAPLPPKNPRRRRASSASAPSSSTSLNPNTNSLSIPHVAGSSASAGSSSAPSTPNIHPASTSVSMLSRHPYAYASPETHSRSLSSTSTNPSDPASPFLPSHHLHPSVSARPSTSPSTTPKSSPGLRSKFPHPGLSLSHVIDHINSEPPTPELQSFLSMDSAVTPKTAMSTASSAFFASEEYYESYPLPPGISGFSSATEPTPPRPGPNDTNLNVLGHHPSLQQSRASSLYSTATRNTGAWSPAIELPPLSMDRLTRAYDGPGATVAEGESPSSASSYTLTPTLSGSAGRAEGERESVWTPLDSGATVVDPVGIAKDVTEGWKGMVRELERSADREERVLGNGDSMLDRERWEKELDLESVLSSARSSMMVLTPTESEFNPDSLGDTTAVDSSALDALLSRHTSGKQKHKRRVSRSSWLEDTAATVHPDFGQDHGEGHDRRWGSGSTSTGEASRRESGLWGVSELDEARSEDDEGARGIFDGMGGEKASEDPMDVESAVKLLEEVDVWLVDLKKRMKQLQRRHLKRVNGLGGAHGSVVQVYQ